MSKGPRTILYLSPMMQRLWSELPHSKKSEIVCRLALLGLTTAQGQHLVHDNTSLTIKIADGVLSLKGET